MGEEFAEKDAEEVEDEEVGDVPEEDEDDEELAKAIEEEAPEAAMTRIMTVSRVVWLGQSTPSRRHAKVYDIEGV